MTFGAKVNTPNEDSAKDAKAFNPQTGLSHTEGTQGKFELSYNNLCQSGLLPSTTYTGAPSWCSKGQEQKRTPRAGRCRPLHRVTGPELYIEVKYPNVLSIPSLIICPCMCGHALELNSRPDRKGAYKSPASMAPSLPQTVSTPGGRISPSS